VWRFRRPSPSCPKQAADSRCTRGRAPLSVPDPRWRRGRYRARSASSRSVHVTRDRTTSRRSLDRGTRGNRISARRVGRIPSARAKAAYVNLEPENGAVALRTTLRAVRPYDNRWASRQARRVCLLPGALAWPAIAAVAEAVGVRRGGRDGTGRVLARALRLVHNAIAPRGSEPSPRRRRLVWAVLASNG
jgi:hypothetical protein